MSEYSDVGFVFLGVKRSFLSNSFRSTKQSFLSLEHDNIRRDGNDCLLERGPVQVNVKLRRIILRNVSEVQMKGCNALRRRSNSSQQNSEHFGNPNRVN